MDAIVSRCKDRQRFYGPLRGQLTRVDSSCVPTENHRVNPFEVTICALRYEA